MLNKIYFALLAVGVSVMFFFNFYAHSWLGSIGSPQAALEGFDYYAGLGTSFLWISSFLLLILANIILWNTRRGWALWTTFAYFAVFIVMRTFWLDRARYNFENLEKVFFSPPLIGVILIIAAGAIVFFNQFVNLRLNEKIYPRKEPEAATEPVAETEE